MKNKIIPYNPKLKELARLLRKQGIKSEIYLWKQIKNKALGVQFHRQVPINNFIVDFYCHEIMLAMEIDGLTHQYEEQKTRDRLRQEKLESLGVKFMRFEDGDVTQNLNFVIDELKKKIQMITASPIG